MTRTNLELQCRLFVKLHTFTCYATLADNFSTRRYELRKFLMEKHLVFHINTSLHLRFLGKQDSGCGVVFTCAVKGLQARFWHVGVLSNSFPHNHHHHHHHPSLGIDTIEFLSSSSRIHCYMNKAGLTSV